MEAWLFVDHTDKVDDRRPHDAGADGEQRQQVEDFDQQVADLFREVFGAILNTQQAFFGRGH